MTNEERKAAIRAAKIELRDALDAGDYNAENMARLRLSQLEMAQKISDDLDKARGES